MSPPDSDLPVRVAFLEDHVTELGVELQDHELRFRAIAAGGGVRDVTGGRPGRGPSRASNRAAAATSASSSSWVRGSTVVLTGPPPFGPPSPPGVRSDRA